MNNYFDFVFQGLNRLWMVSATLIFNGSPQIILQRRQITAPRRPIDIRISAEYSIFENGAQKIDCYVGCVAHRVETKCRLCHSLQFLETKIRSAWHGNVFAINRDGDFLLICEEKWLKDATVPKSAPNSHSLWVHRLLNDDVWTFWVPNATILLIDLNDFLPKQSKMYWKIGLIEWGTVRAVMAVIWMMCFILKWIGSIFLIKPYF